VLLVVGGISAMFAHGQATARTVAGVHPAAMLINVSAIAANPGFGDYNDDGVVDASDYAQWPGCMTGPGNASYPTGCEAFDLEIDNDVDLKDTRQLQASFGQSKGLPNNDYCVNPAQVGDGETAFNTAGATTDGPDEPAACNFFDYTHIESDIWFCYQATCTGKVVMSLCGSEYDTKMAVYEGCGCPVAGPIACDDDGCGFVGSPSRVEFQATLGQSYLIRIGGFVGDRGAGTLTILCDVEVCGPGNGDCFSEHASPGCEDADCCNTMCALDLFCCDVQWDNECATRAAFECLGSFLACAPGAGDCSADNGTPGCDDTDCCNAVCDADLFCCSDTWDDLCACESSVVCDGNFEACGAGAGSCRADNATPGCDDIACCNAVCAQDPFCCCDTWDDICADAAAEKCP
jgi:hypothetical protein